jgi:hypothetical protein
MMTSASASAAPRVEVTIARNTVPLTQDEISRLLLALEGIGSSAATSIAEEISALRLAGVRMQLLPSDREFVALRGALLVADHRPRPASGLTRLRLLCDTR